MFTIRKFMKKTNLKLISENEQYLAPVGNFEYIDIKLSGARRATLWTLRVR